MKKFELSQPYIVKSMKEVANLEKKAMDTYSGGKIDIKPTGEVIGNIYN